MFEERERVGNPIIPPGRSRLRNPLPFRGLDIGVTSSPRTLGSCRTYELGNISITKVVADQRAGYVEGRSGGNQFVTFSFLLEGEAGFRLASKYVSLAKGDGILLNVAEPIHFECSLARTISFEVPRYVLDNTNLSLSDVNGYLISSSSHWGSALHDSLSAIWMMDEDIEIYRSTLESQILSTLAMVIGRPEVQTEDRRIILGLRIRNSIKEMFYNRSISAQKLAKYHNISVRQLHLCLSALGSTYGKELLNSRLRHAEKLLSDIRYHNMPVAEIAYTSGFADASHLRRRLRERHGLSPSEFRATGGISDADDQCPNEPQNTFAPFA